MGGYDPTKNSWLESDGGAAPEKRSAPSTKYDPTKNSWLEGTPQQQEPAPPKQGVGSYGTLQKLANGFEITPNHGTFAPKAQQTVDPMRIEPSDFTQNVSRGRSRGLTPLTGKDIQQITAPLDAGLQSVVRPALGANPIMNAGPLMAHTLQTANAFTGGLGSTLFPQTFDQINKAGDTGSPLANEVLGAAENVAPYLTPAAPVALAGSGASTAINVAEGNESLAAGAGDFALMTAGLKGFKAVGAVEKIVPRIAANVGISEAMYAGAQAVHGAKVTAGGVIGAGITAVPFGIKGHPAQEAQEAPHGALRSLRVKDGVTLDGMHPEAQAVLESLDQTLAANKLKSTITSGVREPLPGQTGKSNHNNGGAIDLRANRQVFDLLQKEGYDVHFEKKGQVNENGTTASGDHIHVNLRKGPKYESLHEQGASNATQTGDIQPNSQSEYQGAFEGSAASADGSEVRSEEGALAGRGDRIGGEAQEPPRTAAVEPSAPELPLDDQNGIQIDQPVLGGQIEEPVSGRDQQGSDRAQPEPLDGGISADGQDRQNNAEGLDARARDFGSDRGGESIRQGAPGENETPPRADHVVSDALEVSTDASARGGREDDSEHSSSVEGVHYGERPILREAARGDKTSVQSPTGNEYDGHYAVVDLSEITPSNDPRSFSAHSDYPPQVQDRDYAHSHDEQAKVIRNGNDLSPAHLINDSPVSDVGPPIVDSKGRVAGGNGRSMSMVRSFASDPKAQQDYKATLVRKASQFGIDPEAIRAEKNPVLVRVLPDVELKSDQQSAALVRELNLSQTTEKDSTASAISAGNSLTAEQHEAIGQVLEKHETLGDAFGDPATSKQLIRSLEKGNIITNENRPRLVEQTKRGPMLSDAGKDFVTDLMASRVLKDPEVARQTPPNIRQKIAKAALPLAQAGRFEGWSLEHPIREAIEDINAQRASGLNDQDWRSQISFDREPLSRAGEAMRNLLADTRQKPLREFAERYANEARADKGESTDEMFGKPERDPAETLVKLAEQVTGKAIEGRPHYTRDDFSRDLQTNTKLSPDERTANLALADAFAKQRARMTGGKAEDFYTDFLRGVTRDAPTTQDALAQSLSGLSESDYRRIKDLDRAPKRNQDGKYANSIEARKAMAETRRAKGFERARDVYAREMAARLGVADPTKLFANRPDVELDFLRDRQAKVVDALQKKYPDVEKGIGFFRRLLDTHPESFGDPLVAELSRNHTAMLKLPEVPVRAALKFENGDMSLGRTHNEALDAAEAKGLRGGQVEEEGYYTNHGRFVGREDAAKLVGMTGRLHSEQTIQSIRKGEPVLYQHDSESAKGAVSFDADGKALIHAFQSADVSTIAHELGHIFRRGLDAELLAKAESALDVKDGNWTVDHEEKFARGFERYLRDGHAPTEALRSVFQSFKQWLGDIYQSLKGSPLEAEVSPQLREVFDRMLGAEAVAPESPVAHAMQTEGLRPASSLAVTIPGAEMVYRDVANIVKKEIVPALRTAAKGVGEAAGQAQGLLAPSSRGEMARIMKGVMRENMADFARKSDILNESFKKVAGEMEKLPIDAKNDFIDRMERGQEQSSPELEAIASSLRAIRDDRVDQVRALGTGKLQSLIENYFPHIWKDPTKAFDAFQQAFARRPFEGNKSWTRQRVIDYDSEGRAMGLERVTDNPIELMLTRVHQMDKFIMAHKVMNEAKELGISNYRRAFEPLQPGETKINDTIGTVYGNPNIPVEEFTDKAVTDALNSVIDKLDVNHERRYNAGRGKLGFARRTGDEMVTQYATDTQVVAHELGHILDFKFGLWDKLTAADRDIAPIGKSGKQLKTGEITKELRALADKTLGENPSSTRQSYARNRYEKMAHMLEAYVHAPDMFKQVAPNTYKVFRDFLDSNPDLHELRDVQPGLELSRQTNTVKVQGQIINGYHVMPEPAARLINNYLSPGLQEKSAAFRGYRALANTMNQFQLGWSGFHAGFVTMDAITSRFALGIYEAAHGDVLKGLRTSATSLTLPIQSFIEGNKMMKEWSKPGSQGEIYSKLIQAEVQGGGRSKMDAFYSNNAWKRMTAAWNDSQGPIEKIVRAGWRLPFALTEKAMAPIQEHLVPRMKQGLFAQMAQYEMEKLGPDATLQQTRDAYGKVWDSVDNRLGQLVYDNLFWDRTTKDIAMASVRSLGWNLGTFRELGGGVIDWGRFGKNLVTPGEKADFTHRMAYTIALPAVTALFGAITQKILTGDAPGELKDYFYPKTGAKEPDGTPARITLPTYMKDVYAYYDDEHKALTIGGNPFRTVMNKLHPAVASISEMLQNKDYYGVQIRNEDDPIMQQLKDVAMFGVRTVEPFAIQGIARNLSQRPFGASTILPMIGVTPAPKSLEQTPAEELLTKYSEEHRTVGSRTKAEAEKSRQRNDLEAAYRTRDKSAAQTIVHSGALSVADIKLAQKQALIPRDAARFSKLPLEEKLNVYERMSPEERSLFAGYNRDGMTLTVRAKLQESYMNELKQGRIRAEDAPALRQRMIAMGRLPHAQKPTHLPMSAAARGNRLAEAGIRRAGQ